jgi:type II secretory pathway pseudopilin PulG
MSATLLRNRVKRDDAGISMIELLVTMLISGIVLAIVGNLLINVVVITGNSNVTTQRNGVATNIMDEVTSVIRTAANNPVSTSVEPDPALVAATATSVTMYSFVDTNATTPAPTKVQFRFDAQGTLLEDRWTATKSNSYWVFTGAVSTRKVGGPVDNLVGTPYFFTYLDANGATLVPGNSGLTLAQRKSVATIMVTVRIANRPTTGSDPIEIINTIGMPNLHMVH